jgi:hypothetical protein
MVWCPSWSKNIGLLGDNSFRMGVLCIKRIMFIIIRHREFVHIFTTVIICHKQEYQKRQYIDDYTFCWQNTKLGINECFLSTLLLPLNWASYPIIISSAKENIYTLVAKIIWLICRKVWYLCIFTRKTQTHRAWN